MIILKINLQGIQLDGYLLSRISMSFNNIIVYFFYFKSFFFNWDKVIIHRARTLEPRIILSQMKGNRL